METTWDMEHMKGKFPSSVSPHTVLFTEARLGIPQGSACSSIVGAYCMARLPWIPMADVVLSNYADDFLLLAKNVSVRAKAIDDLTEAVGNLPGGTFNLKVKKESSAYSGVTFVGHVLQIIDGKLTTWPEQNFEGVYGPLERLDNGLGKNCLPAGPFSGAPGKFNKEEALRLWRGVKRSLTVGGPAFRECDNVDRILTQAYLGINEWLVKIGVSHQLI